MEGVSLPSIRLYEETTVLSALLHTDLARWSVELAMPPVSYGASAIDELLTHVFVSVGAKCSGLTSKALLAESSWTLKIQLLRSNKVCWAAASNIGRSELKYCKLKHPAFNLISGDGKARELPGYLMVLSCKLCMAKQQTGVQPEGRMKFERGGSWSCHSSIHSSSCCVAAESNSTLWSLHQAGMNLWGTTFQALLARLLVLERSKERFDKCTQLGFQACKFAAWRCNILGLIAYFLSVDAPSGVAMYEPTSRSLDCIVSSCRTQGSNIRY